MKCMLHACAAQGTHARLQGPILWFNETYLPVVQVTLSGPMSPRLQMCHGVCDREATETFSVSASLYDET